MAQKTCKICKEEKDSKKDFFASSGRVCRVCKMEQVAEHKKAVGGKVIELLEMILLNQRDMNNRIDQLEDDMSTKMDVIEDKISKVRKRLKAM